MASNSQLFSSLFRAFLSSRDQHLRSVVARRYSEDVPIVNAKVSSAKIDNVDSPL